MHLFYILIASGMLVLTEIPAEQPPPPIPIIAAVAAVSTEGWQTALARFSSSFLDSPSSIGTDGVWMVDATSMSYQEPYQSGTDLTFPIEYVPASFEVGQPIQIQAERLQDGTELIPSEPNVSPTPTIVATPVVVPSLPKAKDDIWQGTYRQASALPITGLAMFYNPNVMQEVFNNRLEMGQISACPECIGNVALLRAGDLNRRVWLQWGDGVVEGPFLVADVAALHHVPQLVARNWVVDVDNATAVRRKMNGPVMVTVWGARPSASQQSAPPFAPLYPTAAVVSSTPTPEATPGASPSAPVMAVQAGFPTETTVPTMTALPAINATPTSGAVATQTAVPTVTVTPTPTPNPTATPSPTSASLAAEAPTVVATAVVTQGGFPTDTPTPTITPLPALNATPTATVAAAILATVPPTATPVPTLEPTVEPTFTPMPSATPSPTPMATVTPTYTALPTETPVPSPTLTPMPTATPSPTLTPAPTATATATETPLPTETPTPEPTMTPTATETVVPTITPTMTPMPTVIPTDAPTATETALPLPGFPTETPVPTITPLPALSPYPTPTVPST